MQTEAEARKLWCPMARVLVVTDQAGAVKSSTAANIFDKGEISLCLASNCAMWRWGRARTHIVPRDRQDDPLFAPSKGWEQTATSIVGTHYTEPRSEQSGYCGIAPVAK